MLKFVSKQNLRLTVPKIALCVFAMGKGDCSKKQNDESYCFDNLSLIQLRGHSEIDAIREFTVPPRLQKKEMVVRYFNKKGERRWHGGRDLKGSQSYPKESLPVSFSICFSFHDMFVSWKKCLKSQGYIDM